MFEVKPQGKCWLANKFSLLENFCECSKSLEPLILENNHLLLFWYERSKVISVNFRRSRKPLEYSHFLCSFWEFFVLWSSHWNIQLFLQGSIFRDWIANLILAFIEQTEKLLQRDIQRISFLISFLITRTWRSLVNSHLLSDLMDYERCLPN